MVPTAPRPGSSSATLSGSGTDDTVLKFETVNTPAMQGANPTPDPPGTPRQYEFCNAGTAWMQDPPTGAFNTLLYPELERRTTAGGIAGCLPPAGEFDSVLQPLP